MVLSQLSRLPRSGSRTLISGSKDRSAKVWWVQADGSFAEAQSLSGYSDPIYL
eukprot:COSAG02_NODE_6785_length_3362_cov_5.357953_4_plen_53_part_00